MGEMWEFAVLAVWCVWLSVTDLRTRRLPNAVTLSGAVAIVGVAGLRGELRPAIVGALLLAGVYLLMHLASPASMGGGDVKLALGLGAATGSAGSAVWLSAAVGAFALTALVGCVLRVAGRRVEDLPHGPSMCFATLAALTL